MWDEVVFFGLQMFITDYLMIHFHEHFFSKRKELVVSEYECLMNSCLGAGVVDCEPISKLHDLGYLPIEIVALPEGMRENEQFTTPIITPTTKAEIGAHDEDISREQIISQGLVSEAEYAQLEKYALALFQRGQEIAAKQGLILVDTKYEFGKNGEQIILMDEVHTPDSSRYFYADEYEERFQAGLPQKQLSKEFVREWLIENGFQGKEGQQVPEMTDEVVAGITDRYVELYECITGEKLVIEASTEDLTARIENNVNNYLTR